MQLLRTSWIQGFYTKDDQTPQQSDLSAIANLDRAFQQVVEESR
ncbi:hypothetical protein [Chroococcidiopsis sp. CCMEE 29]|jgi:hypothetical protein|nr:hypothetical protein [Chroococcidiopsis sp. CCMEE 29]